MVIKNVFRKKQGEVEREGAGLLGSRGLGIQDAERRSLPLTSTL
jgi:hypothetical protein